MIVSTIAGRIRVRSNRLKSRKIAQSVEAKVKTLAGVTEVRINGAAASMIVHFNRRSADVEWLEDQIEAICRPQPQAGTKRSSPLSKQLNRATKVGMMSTLATSLAFIALGKKKPHAQFGMAFVAFAGLHMAKHAKLLLK